MAISKVGNLLLIPSILRYTVAGQSEIFLTTDSTTLGTLIF